MEIVRRKLEGVRNVLAEMKLSLLVISLLVSFIIDDNIVLDDETQVKQYY